MELSGNQWAIKETNRSKDINRVTCKLNKPSESFQTENIVSMTTELNWIEVYSQIFSKSFHSKDKFLYNSAHYNSVGQFFLHRITNAFSEIIYSIWNGSNRHYLIDRSNSTSTNV